LKTASAARAFSRSARGFLLEGFGEDSFAQRDIFIPLLVADVAADLGFRLAGDDEALPGRARRLRLAVMISTWSPFSVRV